MIGFYVAHTRSPDGYHCNLKDPLPFINLTSQKNFVAVHHIGLYGKKELLDWFVGQYPKHSTYKLDMGKSCIRFKKMEDIPYDLIAQLAQNISAAAWIEVYEKAFKK